MWAATLAVLAMDAPHTPTLQPSSAHTASEEVSSAHVAMASDADRRFCPEEDENKGGLERALRTLTRGLTIDVGSYDGTNALSYARAGHEVIAMEPSPSKRAPIEALFAASGHSDSLKLLPIAVSNQTGSLAFYVSTQQGTRSSIIQNGATGSEQDQLDQPPWPSTRVEVPVSTLDAVVGTDRDVVYAKIDAQGHDHEALMGAKELIRSHRLRRVAFELSPGLASGAAPGYVKAVNFLAAAGYRCSSCGSHTSEAGSSIKQLVANLATGTTMFRGTNIGAWTNLVCFAPGVDPAA